MAKKKGKVKAVKPLGRKAMAKAIEFVEEYLANGRNGVRAYLKAYPHVKYDTALTEAARLLVKPCVAEYRDKREEEIRAKHRLTTDDVIKSLSQSLHFDPAKLYNEDGSLKKVTEMDEDTRMVLSSLEVAQIGADGEGGAMVMTKKIKWLDKNTAREQALKHLGMYEKNNRQIGESLALTVAFGKE